MNAQRRRYLSTTAITLRPSIADARQRHAKRQRGGKPPPHPALRRASRARTSGRTAPRRASIHRRTAVHRAAARRKAVAGAIPPADPPTSRRERYMIKKEQMREDVGEQSATGNVRIHVSTMVPARFHFTLRKRFSAPTPMMAVVLV